MPEFAVTGSGEGQRLTLNLRVRAPALVENDDSKRAVVSLSAVLDKSGSMAGSKLTLVKKTCHFMLGQLGYSDKLGVVEYDTNVNELIKLSKTGATFQKEAANMISGMRDGSCTNLSGGLFQGIAQQQSNTYIDWDDLAPAASTNSSADAWVMVEDDMVSLSSASSVSSMSSLANHLDDASLTSHAGALPLQPAVLAGMRNPRPMRGSRGFVTSAPFPRPIFGGVMPPPSRAVEEDAVRSVFLFTDGMANVGLRDQAIVAATKKMLDTNPQVNVCVCVCVCVCACVCVCVCMRMHAQHVVRESASARRNSVCGQKGMRIQIHVCVLIHV